MLTTLPLAAAPPPASPEDEATTFLRALLVVLPRHADPEETRARRAELRRNRDPLHPDRLPARRQARRFEVLLRRGVEAEAARARLRAEEEARAEARRAYQERVRALRAEVEALEDEHRDLVSWIYTGAAGSRRRMVKLLAWASLGLLEQRHDATESLRLEHRRAVVEALVAPTVGAARFPLVKATP
ncbi:MAG: hypothetical protein KF878_04700 [Planctomycetes bacterium]|nr:hypothetical protein [Planctomycetota bacterium]